MNGQSMREVISTISKNYVIDLGNGTTSDPDVFNFKADYVTDIYLSSDMAQLDHITFTEDSSKKVWTAVLPDAQDPSRYILYVPGDVGMGALEFFTEDPGSFIGVSKMPIDLTNTGTIPTKLDRHTTALTGETLSSSEPVYIYVKPSNGNEAGAKVYVLHVMPLDLNLGKLSAITKDMDTAGQSFIDALATTPTINASGEKTYSITVDNTDSTFPDLDAFIEAAVKISAHAEVHLYDQTGTELDLTDPTIWADRWSTILKGQTDTIKLVVTPNPALEGYDELNAETVANQIGRAHV